MSKKTFGLTLVLALVLVACGGPGGEERSDGEVILQITSEGGFAPVDWILARGPVYTLTGDGRLITEGPVIAIFPGPLLPNYQVARISEGEVDQILDLIERMGLPQITDETDDSALNFVADATTEVITYWDENGTHRYGAYALGIDENPEREATKTFLELRNALDRLATSGETEPYVGESVRVLAGQGILDPEFEDVRDWPFEETDFSQWQEFSEGWRCRVFSSDILETFANASQSTLWTAPEQGSNITEVKLLVRPLLPGEQECPTELPIGG